MKIEIDKDKCIGCGLCRDIGDGLFKIGEDGKAESTIDPVPIMKEQYGKEGEYVCPVNAIRTII
ncbi:ferredoxin [Clostridium sporogenes]|uniref:4Fe-4S binding domain protein n=3 Tax=Clostridium TaxID=1485 RepID=A0A1J1CX97_CLOSG|nr:MULTISPECIES: ferredoxin [Clostridium]AJD30306.1 4Fe-4S binding domain protein [Clostridium botulinum Prevot_594]AKC60852.1 ferredoxin [Clostridium sporogenes]AKJ88211.1 (Fe-S)-binding protein [Clostridium sporogenes]APF27215.1 4Fe-4S binding domain protein [Clostridium sporogenes]APH16846.1 4Fe-4S binding domain protein [Clostridium sporogenes]